MKYALVGRAGCHGFLLGLKHRNQNQANKIVRCARIYGYDFLVPIENLNLKSVEWFDLELAEGN